MPRSENPDPSRGASWMRDHLANERTLLAWVRTSLALVAFGLAIAKLAAFIRIATLDHPEMAADLPNPVWSKLLGTALIGAGVVTISLGAWRSAQWVREVPGDPPRNGPLWAMSAATIVVALVVGVYVALG
jgi:putative membrane protein